MANLADLPQELRERIASYLISNKDLLALDRTCKQIHDTSLRALYRKLVISTDTSILKLAAILSPQNPGLRHVRGVEILPTYDEDDDGEEQLNNIFGVLAYLLPPGTVRTFTYVYGKHMLPTKFLTSIQARPLRWLAISIGGGLLSATRLPT
jgi:hypothetical protein